MYTTTRGTCPSVYRADTLPFQPIFQGLTPQEAERTSPGTEGRRRPSLAGGAGAEDGEGGTLEARLAPKVPRDGVDAVLRYRVHGVRGADAVRLVEDLLALGARRHAPLGGSAGGWNLRVRGLEGP